MDVVFEKTLIDKKSRIIILYNRYTDPSNGYPAKVTKEIAKIQDDIERMRVIWNTSSGNDVIDNLSSILSDIEAKFGSLNMIVSISGDDISWKKEFVRDYDKPTTR